MARLGPFEPNPALAVAVSGGPDSMALALLAQEWVNGRGGTVLALTVDHGLRPESATEAALTVRRLAEQPIPVRVLALSGLSRGPALAERARIARYAVLTEACRSAGLLHLLLGHHALDQAETLAMRILRNTDSPGLAGIPGLRETSTLRLLRPLLGMPPDVLRHYLRQQGVGWVEDPSNKDTHALRPRLRPGLSGTGVELARVASLAGQRRAWEEQAQAEELASQVELRPEGFALMPGGRMRPAAFRALLRTIAGAAYAVSPGRITRLAAEPYPATLAGVRILPAGRLGQAWLVVREEVAVEGSIPAAPEVIWDRRFRIFIHSPVPRGASIGKLGDAAPRFRRLSSLPSAVLRTLPALWCDGVPLAVPHLSYAAPAAPAIRVLFAPPVPLAGGVFLPG